MQKNNRDEIQNNAVVAWLNANKVGTVEMSTGTGKTFVALHCLHTMKKDHKIHLHLAESREREKDFRKSVKLYDEIYSCDTFLDYNIKFSCYQTAHKWENKEFGLVISDEIHDALTPVYSKFYKNNTYEAIIGLSAKINKNITYEVGKGVLTASINKGYYLDLYAPIIFTYTLTDARNDNLTRNLDVHIISHYLDDITKNFPSGSKDKPFFQTERDAYMYWDKKFEEADKEKDLTKKNIFKKISSLKRSNVLYNLKSKVIACKKLLIVLNKTLIFGNSIDSLIKVTPYVISSRNSNPKNDYFRDLFEKGKIDNLASFKKLKQGANINGLNNLIIMSYYSSEIDIIQRFGRLRMDDGKKGRVFIFVTRGTKEQEWYLTMLENIHSAYNFINHKNVNECIQYLKEENGR